VLLLYCAGSAFAQTETATPPQAGRPFPAIFGGSLTSTAGKTLNFTNSVEQGYDDNSLPLALSSPVNDSSAYQTSGPYTALTPALEFEAHGRSQIRAQAGSEFRYYRDLGQMLLLNHSAEAEVYAPFGRKTIISGAQRISYDPASISGLFTRPTDLYDTAADLALPPGITNVELANYALHPGRSYTFLTNVGIAERITPRGTLEINGDVGSTRYVDRRVAEVAGFSDLTSYHLGSRFEYHVNRNLSLQTAYTYGRARYASTLLNVQEHDADAGFTYQQRLSASRHMIVKGNVGTTFYGFASAPPPLQPALPQVGLSPTEPPQVEPSQPPTSVEPKQHFGVSGNLYVERDIGRTWSASGHYERGLFYVSGLRNAVYSDSVTLGSHGFVNGRTDLTFSGAYSKGSFVLAGDESGGALVANDTSDFRTYTFDVHARVALLRAWAAYVEYVHYYYRFNGTLDVPSAFPNTLTRNSVRVGLTLWVPIMRKH
jgi:hypothetical protein